MKLPFRRFVFILAIGGVAPRPLPAASSTLPPHSWTAEVVYGRKFGMALTMDIVRPEQPNGFGIVYLVSGGWVSRDIPQVSDLYAPFLRHGYTVFSVRHGSRPKFTITEITQDIHRAIRFVRHNAAKWNVNPDKLGISGGSAGGHLSLTMGVRGEPGDPSAKDPIDRESSAIQAIACLYPPTDFLNYGKPGEDAVGVGILKNYKEAFGAAADTAEGRQRLGREISPLYHVTARLPPTLIIHGNRDTLVPIQQAEIFVGRAKDLGATAELIVKDGAGHGWTDRRPEYERFAQWFDHHLRGGAR